MRNVYLGVSFEGVVKVSNVPHDVDDDLVKEIVLAVCDLVCNPNSEDLDFVNPYDYKFPEGSNAEKLVEQLANSVEIISGTLTLFQPLS